MASGSEEGLAILLEPAEITATRWQLRALWLTRHVDFYLVVLSVIAHSYDAEAIQKLLWMLTGQGMFTHTFICSSAKINHKGYVVADIQYEDGYREKNVLINRSTTGLRDRFREIADDLKLNDADRLEMFAAVAKWIAADQRLDPTMDSRDPDARRLVH